MRKYTHKTAHLQETSHLVFVPIEQFIILHKNIPSERVFLSLAALICLRTMTVCSVNSTKKQVERLSRFGCAGHCSSLAGLEKGALPYKMSPLDVMVSFNNHYSLDL